jgi:hypothetical protein
VNCDTHKVLNLPINPSQSLSMKDSDKFVDPIEDDHRKGCINASLRLWQKINALPDPGASRHVIVREESFL